MYFQNPLEQAAGIIEEITGCYYLISKRIWTTEMLSQSTDLSSRRGVGCPLLLLSPWGVRILQKPKWCLTSPRLGGVAERYMSPLKWCSRKSEHDLVWQSMPKLHKGHYFSKIWQYPTEVRAEIISSFALQCLSVLCLIGIELNFFTAASRVLCFRFVTETVLVTQQCLGYWWLVVFVLPRLPLSLFPFCE